jgi:uncharacterized protein
MFSAILVLAVFWVSIWSFNTTAFYILQKKLLYWNYSSHILMIALAIGAIALMKRDFASYGFKFGNWRSDFSIAAICVISAASFVPSLILPAMTSNYELGAVFSIGATLLTLFLVSKKTGMNEKNTSSKKGMSWAAFTPLFPIAVIAGGVNYALIASTAVFQFFFAGFGEEILFRGYVQSRLNEGFGRPWVLAGVKFGPSLLITSVLFGVMHLLNPFNPFQGQYEFAIWSGITSTVSGFLFGFIREKTGNVIAPSFAHGLVDLGQVIPLIIYP